MRIARVIVVVLIGLLARMDVVVAGQEQTNALIKSAIDSYSAQGYERALDILEQAVRNKGNSREQLIRIYHVKGLCLASLGMMEEAEKAFLRLLAIDPSFRLGNNIAPRIRSVPEKLLAKYPNPLEVKLAPPAFAVEGKPMVMSVEVLSDASKAAHSVRLWFRRGTNQPYSSVRAKITGEVKHRIRIPPAVWQGGKGWTGDVCWYAVLEDAHHGQLVYYGARREPNTLGVRSVEQAASAEKSETAWYERWWVWALMGGAVVAATTTAVVLASPGGSSGPLEFEIEVTRRQ